MPRSAPGADRQHPAAQRAHASCHPRCGVRDRLGDRHRRLRDRGRDDHRRRATAPRTVAAIIHLAVGTASLAFALRALIRGPQPAPKKEDVAPEHEHDKPAWQFVFAGLVAMGVNMTALVLYLSLDAEIVRAQLSTFDDAIALAIAP